MANRGWRPRSTRTTRRPRLSSASAASDPAKPDPTTATSASMRFDGNAGRHWRHALLIAGRARHVAGRTSCSRFIACRRSRRAAMQSRAVREPLEIPEIDEHPSTPSRVCQGQREAALDVFEVWRAEPSGGGQRVDRAVARPRRHQRHDGGAAGEGGVDRAQQPRVLLVARERTAARSAGRRAAPRPRSSSALAACAKRSSVNRLFSRSSATGCAVSRPIATSSRGGASPGP